MHLTDHDLAALLQGADDGALRLTREHVVTCDACRDAFEWVRSGEQRIGALLECLDHRAQRVSFGVIQARAAHPQPAGLSLSAASHRDVMGWPPRNTGAGPKPGGQSYGRVVRWTALALGVAAGAALAAMPTSPLRHVIASVLARSVSEPLHSGVPMPAQSTQETTPAESSRGVAITPRNHSVVLIWRAPQADGVIRIRPTPTETRHAATVSVLAGGDGVTYEIVGDTIRIDNRAATRVNFEVELPAPSDVAAVTLLVGDRVVFRRRGSVLTTRAERGPDGGYSIRLAQDEQ